MAALQSSSLEQFWPTVALSAHFMVEAEQRRVSRQGMVSSQLWPDVWSGWHWRVIPTTVQDLAVGQVSPGLLQYIPVTTVGVAQTLNVGSQISIESHS